MNYTPGDIFRAMGCHWIGEDKFRYPMDPNLQDSEQVLNTMMQEWSFMVTQSEDMYNQMIRHGLVVPHRVATNMQRDSIHGLHMALNRIREENN